MTQMDVSQQSQENVGNVSQVSDFQTSLGTFTGEMKNGKKHGFGHLICADGTKYICDWVDDRKKSGCVFLNDGTIFSGEFNQHDSLVEKGHLQVNVMGSANSHFLVKFLDGQFFSGIFESGVATFVNGWTFHCDKYVGGKPHGKGKVRNCAGKAVYESEWKDGYDTRGWYDLSSVLLKFGVVLVSLGLLILVISWLYSLSFLISKEHHVTDQTKRHGLGVVDIAGKGRYNGSWAHGQRHGLGSMEYTNTKSPIFGYSFVGEWAKDCPVSGMLKYRNGDVYNGSVHHDCNDFHKQGFGSFYSFSDDTTYVGDFVEDVREGHGKLIQFNGSYCEGEWRTGLQDGPGFCVDNTSFLKPERFDGVWRQGMKVSGVTVVRPTVFFGLVESETEITRSGKGTRMSMVFLDKWRTGLDTGIVVFTAVFCILLFLLLEILIPGKW